MFYLAILFNKEGQKMAKASLDTQILKAKEKLKKLEEKKVLQEAKKAISENEKLNSENEKLKEELKYYHDQIANLIDKVSTNPAENNFGNWTAKDGKVILLDRNAVVASLTEIINGKNDKKIK